MVKQMKLLHNVAGRLGATDEKDKEEPGILSEDARQRILKHVCQHDDHPKEDE